MYSLQNRVRWEDDIAKWQNPILEDSSVVEMAFETYGMIVCVLDPCPIGTKVRCSTKPISLPTVAAFGSMSAMT